MTGEVGQTDLVFFGVQLGFISSLCTQDYKSLYVYMQCLYATRC